MPRRVTGTAPRRVFALFGEISNELNARYLIRKGSEILVIEQMGERIRYGWMPLPSAR